MTHKKLKETANLLAIVHRLRKECPWDRKQTHRSLVPYLVEEAYEAIDEIERGTKTGFLEELGDLLLQIVLHAEIASEKGEFDFESIAKTISEKMVRRHPHVFSGAQFRDLQTHLKNWTIYKTEEKPKGSILEGIPKSMPALLLAQRYGELASSVGFDFPTVVAVLKKVREELLELELEIRRKGKSRKKAVEMELGDLLFAVSNLGRHLGFSSEQALRKSSHKYFKRFSLMERSFRRLGRPLSECSLSELDLEWEKAKSATDK